MLSVIDPNLTHHPGLFLTHHPGLYPGSPSHLPDLTNLDPLTPTS
jgi:hypothetical protein